MKKRFFRRIVSLLSILMLLETSSIVVMAGNTSGRVEKVGFFHFDGYHMMEDDGYKNGYGYDFVEMLSRYNNMTYEFVGYDKSWADMFNMLDSGEIDMLSFVQKTPEREEKYDFSTEAIGSTTSILTAREDEETLLQGDYSRYNGVRVGMLAESIQKVALDEFALEKGFTYEPVYFDDIESMQNALQVDKTIDCGLTSNLRSLDNEVILEQFYTSDFYVIVKKGNTELLDEINSAIEQMDAVDSSWRQELFNKYYTKSKGENIQFTSEEQAYLSQIKEEGKVFQVVVNPDRKPYSYVEDGEVKGIFPEIFKEIARRTGIQYKIVVTTTREEYQNAVSSENTDICMDGRFDYSPAADAGYELSDPYLSTSISKITRSDFNGDVQKIAALNLPDWRRSYMDKLYDGKEIAYYDSIDECVKAVRTGRADATYLYSYAAQAAVNEDITNAIAVTLLPEYPDQFGVAVKATEDYRLLSILNKGVNSLETDFVEQAIMNVSDYSRNDYSLVSYLYQNPISVAVILSVLGIVIVVIIYFGLKVKYAERVKEEEEKQKQALQDALNIAQEASAAKGSFLSRMSHEIRTPLNAVIGYMTIAKMPDSNKEKIMHCINNSEIAAKHLLSLINDVLDISAIESGKMKIAYEEFAMGEVITSVSTIFYNQAHMKGVIFKATNENLTEEHLIGDSLRVNQVLMNLLSNAVKFTPAGGKVSLNIEQVSNNDNRVYIKFEVQDTGIGMSQEYLKKLFTPFEQESATTAKNYGGSGLGLSITQNLITMMNGSIDVDSKQGEGTTFKVLLGFDRVSSTGETEIPAVGNKKLRILLVEDATADVESMKNLLKSCDLKCDVVSEAMEAVKQISRRQDGDYAYAMCIIDCSTDGAMCIETAKCIKENCKDKAPILVATTYDATEIDDLAEEAGIANVILKPVFQSTIYDLLSEIYGKNKKSKDLMDTSMDFHGVRLLLAEDNAMNLEIAKDIIEKAGIKVITATDGTEACQRFEESKPGEIQIILMDIQMPKMDGYEATKVIRNSSHADAKTIPIIAMTANAFAEDVAKAYATGMNGHIAKPIDYKKLFEVLQNKLTVQEEKS